MKIRTLYLVFASVLVIQCMRPTAGGDDSIPLPEHPRPDFQRASWLNLNGPWQFRFDPSDSGLKEQWYEGKASFPETITVPFPWGSALSGVPDRASIAWYARTLRAPEAWNGRRVFLVIGACDWETQAWLDRRPLGTHRGGYTPFEFELTPYLIPNRDHRLVLRVDDAPRPFKLEGKQGYGNARGIWQTVYLEARPQIYLETIHFLPDIETGKVTVKAKLSSPAIGNAKLKLHFKSGGLPDVVRDIPRTPAKR